MYTSSFFVIIIARKHWHVVIRTLLQHAHWNSVDNILILFIVWLQALIRLTSSSDIILGTSEAPLSCWNSISFIVLTRASFFVEHLPLPRSIMISIASCIDLLRRVLLSTSLYSWGAIEIIEYQIHIFYLFILQMILDCFISVHFNFYMSILLPWESPRLLKIVRLIHFIRSRTHIVRIWPSSVLNFSLRLVLRRDVESLSA